tara:strand:- start:34 stop:288 length:255 start_codon:yes stop_codon:yes gene_type:complete
MKIINGQLIKLTEEEAREEFNNLLYDDNDFQAQWGYCEGLQTKINEDDIRVLTYRQALEEQENAFYEWCSVSEDTKHLKKEDKG